MSSHSKRRAESEEVAHKKKPRKEENDEFKPDEENGDVELEDEGAKIAGPGDDGDLESEGGKKGKKAMSAGSSTRSPQRNVEANINEDEDEDEYEEEYDEDGNEEDDAEDYVVAEDEEEGEEGE